VGDTKGIGLLAFVLALFMFLNTQAFAWDDICKMGGEALSLTNVQLQDYYKDNIKGRPVEGKGYIRDVWQHGVNKEYAVKVDCGNDVIVNISTSSDCRDLKTGQGVSFDGHCISFDRRAYSNTKKPYMHFELERGSVK